MPDTERTPAPEYVVQSLLDRVTSGSLDQDYAAASARRAAEDQGRGRGRRTPAPIRRAPIIAVMLVFGLLLTTAAVQTARSAPQRESSQESLVGQVQERRDELETARSQVDDLQREVEQAQDAALTVTQTGRSVQERLTQLGSAAGTAVVQGPGVEVTVDDSPEAQTDNQIVLDTDLQILVNGLWVAGAEAIDINGQRLTNLTAIRVAGEAITVNLRSLTQPYVVRAIGDPDQLAARFVETAGGQWWLNLQAVYGLQFSLTTEESLTVPAAPLPRLRHAIPVEVDP